MSTLPTATAPEELKCGFFISHLGFYDVQNSLTWDTVAAIVMALSATILVLGLATRNIGLTIAAAVTVCSIIFVTVGVLVLLFDWKLNILESVAITLSIGLSVDFSLHYAVTYSKNASLTASTSSSAKKAKSATVERSVIYAVANMAAPVSMAALTTFLAGVCLLPTRVLAYIQIGTFIVILMSTSWLFSTFFLHSLLHIVIGRRGSKFNDMVTADQISVNIISSNNKEQQQEEGVNSSSSVNKQTDNGGDTDDCNKENYANEEVLEDAKLPQHCDQNCVIANGEKQRLHSKSTLSSQAAPTSNVTKSEARTRNNKNMGHSSQNRQRNNMLNKTNTIMITQAMLSNGIESLSKVQPMAEELTNERKSNLTSSSQHMQQLPPSEGQQKLPNDIKTLPPAMRTWEYNGLPDFKHIQTIIADVQNYSVVENGIIAPTAQISDEGAGDEMAFLMARQHVYGDDGILLQQRQQRQQQAATSSPSNSSEAALPTSTPNSVPQMFGGTR